MSRVKVGDTVVLNDEGLETCFGRGKVNFLSHMKTKRMKITHVDTESMCSPEELFIVEVDDPDINMLLINDWCFDVVGGSK